jgi:hypothetical protein
MAKKAITKKSALAAGQVIMSLMGEIAGTHPLERRFCELYSFILKQLPDFQIALS